MQELTPFDLVVECAGIQETVDEGTRLTRPGGRLSIFSWHHQPRSVPLGAWHIKGLTVTNVGPAIFPVTSGSTSWNVPCGLIGLWHV